MASRQDACGQTKCDVFYFFEHFVFIVSQEACESRDIIYDERAKPVMSVFLNFLIKKSGCFLQRVVCLIATQGRAYLQLEKLQLEK